MFGIFSFVPELQAQQNQGVPWWIWLLVLIVVIALLIWWLRRSEARSPASSAGKKPAAAEMKGPEPLPAEKAPPLTEAVAAAPAPEAVAEGAGRAIEAPIAEALAVSGPRAAAELATARDLGADEIPAAAVAPPVVGVPAVTAMAQAEAGSVEVSTAAEGAGRATEVPIAEALAVPGPLATAELATARDLGAGELPAAVAIPPPVEAPAVAAGAASVEVPAAATGVAVGAGVLAAKSAAVEQVDDLTRIEGIGPKIAGHLKANGIGSFQQLAAADVPGLRKMLADAKLANLADPETWPEQAALAAAGKWDELQSLQAQLIGGRRVQANDLTLVEGIGPKIAGLLQQAGIKTFRQLAAADVSRLREILVKANLRNLADPETWPEQAGLAAAGRWEELQALTAKLKGGRRV